MSELNVTPELIQDLEVIAQLMKKHDLQFYVSIEGDTHGVDCLAGIEIGRHWFPSANWSSLSYTDVLEIRETLAVKLKS